MALSLQTRDMHNFIPSILSISKAKTPPFMDYLISPSMIPGYFEATKLSFQPTELPSGAPFVFLSVKPKNLPYKDPFIDTNLIQRNNLT